MAANGVQIQLSYVHFDQSFPHDPFECKQSHCTAESCNGKFYFICTTKEQRTPYM